MKTDENNINPLMTEEKKIIVQRRFKELIACKPIFSEPENFAKIEAAFLFAFDAHKNEFRKTGAKLPYIVHPIAVAKIVAVEMGYSVTMVQAALLHDTIEDVPEVDVDVLTEKFGSDVSFLVDSVTKITYDKDSGLSEQVETFKHLILAMTRDRRVAYLKIADRLHNLRTMWGMKESSKMVKTAESLDLYAPLAHKLGLFDIKKQIEDWSFRYREPAEHEKIETAALSFENALQKKDKETFKLLTSKLVDSRLRFKIQPVYKSLYKAWRITSKENIPFAKLHNFRSLRLVIEESQDFSPKELCFLMYASITSHFQVRPRSMKDWVSYPKSNGFQSIVMDVFLNNAWVEIQLLTTKMHQIAMRGYADDFDNSHQNNIDDWVRETRIELENSELSNSEIMDLLRPQEREINVFTPTGQVIKLPKGSTVLDFAFKIHSEMGLHFKTAELNGRLVPYNQVLRYGDQIYISHDLSIEPDKEWLKYLACSNNRNLLNRYFRKQKRLIIDDGEKIFSTIEHEHLDKHLNAILAELRCKNKEKLFHKLGRNAVSSEDILRIISKLDGFRSWFTFRPFRAQPLPPEQNTDIKFSSSLPFVIDLISSNITLADCCKPVRGDAAMVYRISPGKFIVHKRDCDEAKNLNATHKAETTSVKWRESGTGGFVSVIKFEGKDRMNLVSDIIQIISAEMQINMSRLEIDARNTLSFGTIYFTVDNKRNLDRLISRMKKVPDIINVYRSA